MEAVEAVAAAANGSCLIGQRQGEELFLSLPFIFLDKVRTIDDVSMLQMADLVLLMA